MTRLYNVMQLLFEFIQYTTLFEFTLSLIRHFFDFLQYVTLFEFNQYTILFEFTLNLF